MTELLRGASAPEPHGTFAPETLRLGELAAQSGVQFGTSGARGLVTAMTDRVCHAYAAAFLSLLRARGQLGARVAVAGDRRPSTPRIMAAVGHAIRAAGCEVVNCGLVPTPAVALYGFTHRIPTMMVTGSHIPDDRNGIKFTTPTGELEKRDEAPMFSTAVELPPAFDGEGALLEPASLPEPIAEARDRYAARFEHAYGRALEGLSVGVYGHSAVGRELLGEVLHRAGARVVPLGFSERFVPVDTEALRPEDVVLADGWAREHVLDAIVSTDGDSDRPLIADATGRWLRGDIVGILCARALAANIVVTPVSSNSAVERSGWFDTVVRTRIGSPYVIEAMQQHAGHGRVVGYEGNGGFLQQSDAQGPAGSLPALPTRDAFIVIVALLAASKARGLSLADLVAELPPRFTASDRLKDVPQARSQALIEGLVQGGATAVYELTGERLVAVDTTDGYRMSFESGVIVHLRPSGNAPELRCYAEAETPERAAALVRNTLTAIAAST